MNKRQFLKTGLLMGTGAAIAPGLFRNTLSAAEIKATSFTGEFLQVPLPYAYNSLEPNIDARTMELHYTKHHAGYTKKFNDSVKDEKLEGMSIEEIFSNVDKFSGSIRNNGGGYYNHNLFWLCLSPDGGGEPAGALMEMIVQNFGSFEAFKNEFSKAAATVFGSGWAWLINQEGKLKIVSTPNQDNPLMNTSKERGTPLLCLDVWEHAYYLNYQNRRADYIASFWNIIDWKFVSSNLVK